MSQQGPIPEVDVAEAADRLQAGTAVAAAGSGGPLLVDVREADEIADFHVPGSLHAPMSNLPDAAQRIPAGRQLLLICASGRRSLVAAEYLRRNGHDEVANVSGGIIEWRKRGLPTESGPLAPAGES